MHQIIEHIISSLQKPTFNLNLMENNCLDSSTEGTFTLILNCNLGCIFLTVQNLISQVVTRNLKEPEDGLVTYCPYPSYSSYYFWVIHYQEYFCRWNPDHRGGHDTAYIDNEIIMELRSKLSWQPPPLFTVGPEAGMHGGSNVLPVTTHCTIILIKNTNYL